MSFDATPVVSTKIIEVDCGFGNHTGVPISLIVVDSDIPAGATVIAVQSGEAATGGSADENELDQFIVNVSVNSVGGSMTMILRPMASVTLTGRYKINYVIG